MSSPARFFFRLALLSVACLACAAVARADFVQTLHTFMGGASDGANPGTSRLVEGTDGFMYGVTRAGGANGGGTFFRIGKDGTGFTVLHSFNAGDTPTWLIQASDGFFYGTQYSGGGGTLPGAVFRIAPDGTFLVVKNNGIFVDGYSPVSIIEANNHLLYVVNSKGGNTGHLGFPEGGTLLWLNLGGWPWNIAHYFGVESNIYGPGSFLIQGSDGNLYGMKNNTYPPNGHAFQYTPSQSWGGPVTEFNATNLTKGLEEGPDAAFYGVVTDGGACGRIDRITMTTQAPLHAFDCVSDLGRPTAAPVSGRDGYLYGTTLNTFYRVNPAGEYTPLATMTDGAAGPLLHGSDGNWYGMTANTIFKLVRTGKAPGVGFDGDAMTDMPLYDATTGTWRILTTASGFQSSRQVFWGGPSYTPVPADYDGDGRLDVAVYHAGRGIWYVLTSSSNFTTVIMKTLGGLGSAPAPGDFDGDGRADFAVYRSATGAFTIASSRTSSTTTFTIAAPGGVPVRGDFDGDNVADAAVYAPATGAWRILTSTSGYTTLVTRSLGGPGFAPVTGDYDGDRSSDIAVYDGASGVWHVLQSSTNSIVTIGWGGTGFAPVPGDYDADGRTDVAVYSVAGGEWYALLSSTGLTTVLWQAWGTPIDSAVTMLPVRTAWNDALRASDFDGDGASDIAVYEASTGLWSILTSSSRFTRTMSISWGATPGDVPVPGDYDGDGIADAAVFNPASGTWTLLRSSLGGLTVALGAPGDIAVAADYDGDLVTDPAVYNVSTGTWRVALSSSSFAQTRNVTYGLPYLTAVPADYDGDGRADFGLYDPFSGDWQALLSTTGYATPPTTNAWGGAGYTPVPADFDGDRKADYAVCVKPIGTWHVLNSGFTYSTAFGVAWGTPIDTPRAADYDGDGVADMASYDSTTGEWRLLLSSSGFTLAVVRSLGGPGFILPRMP